MERDFLPLYDIFLIDVVGAGGVVGRKRGLLRKGSQ